MGTTRNAGCLSGSVTRSPVVTVDSGSRAWVVAIDVRASRREPLGSRRLLSGLVAQLAAQDLAHVRLGQLGPKLDVPRTLVPRQLFAAMREQGFTGQRRVFLDDEQLDRFA